MPPRPLLTREDLIKIRARYEITPGRAPCSYQDSVVWRDVVTLLYESRRLRAMLLIADQLRDRFPKPANFLDSVWKEFQANLAAEPCVQEMREMKAELIDPVGRNRKGA